MTNLAYDIVRSPKRRKLTITVERNCAVIVRAPANISDGEVARVVDSKRQWIWRNFAILKNTVTDSIRPAKRW